jgi:predicted nucleic acid-binding protein
MILIDTNVVLASIRQPVTPQDAKHHDRATALLGQISTGDTQAIISEIVLHECFYVLVMRDKSISTNEFCSLFRRLLAWDGWAMPEAELNILSSAFDILEAYPKLEFSDAVIASRAEYHGAELATFDKRLASAYGGKTWSES